MYKYNKRWFLGSEIKAKILNFVDTTKMNTILEIGCYEGLSSVFFADNLLDHSKSSLTCVDPFMNFKENDHKKILKNNEESNFDYNIQICKNNDKIIVNKTTSDLFFSKNTKTYNIY